LDEVINSASVAKNGLDILSSVCSSPPAVQTKKKKQKKLSSKFKFKPKTEGWIIQANLLVALLEVNPVAIENKKRAAVWNKVMHLIYANPEHAAVMRNDQCQPEVSMPNTGHLKKLFDDTLYEFRFRTTHSKTGEHDTGPSFEFVDPEKIAKFVQHLSIYKHRNFP
jgi:hypothetical protein